MLAQRLRDLFNFCPRTECTRLGSPRLNWCHMRLSRETRVNTSIQRRDVLDQIVESLVKLFEALLSNTCLSTYSPYNNTVLLMPPHILLLFFICLTSTGEMTN